MNFWIGILLILCTYALITGVKEAARYKRVSRKVWIFFLCTSLILLLFLAEYAK